MPSLFTEDTYERAIIELFENMGYDHLYAPDFDRDYTSPFLDTILRDSLVRINRGLPVEAIDEALSKLKICRSPRIPDSHSAHRKKRKRSEKHSNILG